MSDDATPPEAGESSPKLPRYPRRAWLALGLAAALGIAAAGYWGRWFAPPPPPRDLADRSALGLDLTRPDALIESASLGRLPRDLLRVRLLRDTLTEDFVFYYQSNADRLGLAGSLRRIIYEHDLTLKDNLIDELLDQPAEVALWRGPGGKLAHFLLVIERGGLERLLEPLLHLALDDTQLARVGEVWVEGEPVGLYRLRYGAGHRLLFASHGDRLLVLGSPEMLQATEEQATASTEDEESASEEGKGDGTSTAQSTGAASKYPRLARAPVEAVEALLADGQALPARFGLDPRDGEIHRLTLDTEVLTLGYQRLVPAFAGLRFEMDAEGWHGLLALDEVEDAAALDFRPVWQAMPLGAAACAALPTAPRVLHHLLDRLGADPEQAGEIANRLGGGVGLCWYVESRLHSPLVVGVLSRPATPEIDAELGRLFGKIIGAHEDKAESGTFPVIPRQEGDLRRWSREVSSNFGAYAAKDASQPKAVTASGFFRVTLARAGSTLLFSLDDRLIDKALDTVARRYPPLGETLPGDALVPIFLAPEDLARVFEQETLESLPANLEPVFRNAAQAHLLPKLHALAGHGRFVMTLPRGSEPDRTWQWLPLGWQAL